VISMARITRLPVAPETVWAFFSEMDQHYTQWVPEHLDWRWLRGNPLEPGSIWYADEWIGPLRISTRFFVDDADPGRFFSYRIAFPASLIGARGSFRLEATATGGCDVVEQVHLGFAIPIVGALLDQLISVVLPLGEFRRHMQDESAGLVRIFGSEPLLD
jgi:Polyketide cyclase / dehydrase and lipid transport